MDKNDIHFFYQRDIQRVIDEIALLKDEANIWKICGSTKNSAGNLALHLIGGLNYLIGTNILHTDMFVIVMQNLPLKVLRRNN